MNGLPCYMKLWAVIFPAAWCLAHVKQIPKDAAANVTSNRATDAHIAKNAYNGQKVYAQREQNIHRAFYSEERPGEWWMVYFAQEVYLQKIVVYNYRLLRDRFRQLHLLGRANFNNMRPASLEHFKWNIILVTNDSVPSNDHIKWQADDRDNPPQYSSIALLTDNTHGLVIREVDLYGHYWDYWSRWSDCMSTASGCMRNRSRECVGDTKKGTETSCKGSQSNQAHTCLCPSYVGLLPKDGAANITCNRATEAYLAKKAYNGIKYQIKKPSTIYQGFISDERAGQWWMVYFTKTVYLHTVVVYNFQSLRDRFRQMHMLGRANFYNIRRPSLRSITWDVLLVVNNTILTTDHVMWQSEDRSNLPQYSSIALLSDNTNGLAINEVDLYGHYWDDWSEWASCVSSSSGCKRNRTRVCVGNTKNGTETSCAGHGPHQVIPCTCPTDGGWTEWEIMSECSVTCGEGFQTRMRACENPKPRHGGASCRGADYEQIECADNETSSVPCPVDGSWSGWSGWSECSQTCGGEGVNIRIMYCNNPEPSDGGRLCQGDSEGKGQGEQTRRCTSKSRNCSSTPAHVMRAPIALKSIDPEGDTGSDVIPRTTKRSLIYATIPAAAFVLLSAAVLFIFPPWRSEEADKDLPTHTASGEITNTVSKQANSIGSHSSQYQKMSSYIVDSPPRKDVRVFYSSDKMNLPLD